MHDELIPLVAVCRELNLSPAAVERLVAEKKLPLPTVVSAEPRWWSDEILAAVQK